MPPNGNRYNNYGFAYLVLVAHSRLFKKKDIIIPTTTPDIEAHKNHLKNNIDIHSLSLTCDLNFI
ncbi:MAG: hypothetical protein E7C86_03445 [Paeniclostridium sordellii]|uniref:hypothetical protein n=1 Tax=Paeniclostridium hominis TaxID=2764329 RepID=UPI001A9ACB69|nr:hypothetical protein [Paeniclostridium hominis]MDU2591652.1 hypothetical protein [Paeniclostridium sordellii]